jgi:myo-inositol-1(or 4)-monophosphatase
VQPKDALAIALTVGREAAKILHDGWGHAGKIGHKESAFDLITEWDTRAEEHIARRLAELAPGVTMLGEEGGERAGAAEAEGRWLVDPIDGTVNFAHALPIFAVSIGYEIADVVHAGVVIAPALGWEFTAARGGGSFMNGERLTVSTTASLAHAMLATGFPVDRAVSPKNNFREFDRMQLVAGAVRRLGAASLDLCFVARGWLDGYWEYKLKPWDLAAGSLVVEEAGGRVTALDGGRFVASSGETIATNGRIHDEVVATLSDFR